MHPSMSSLPFDPGLAPAKARGSKLLHGRVQHSIKRESRSLNKKAVCPLFFNKVAARSCSGLSHFLISFKLVIFFICYCLFKYPVISPLMKNICDWPIYLPHVPRLYSDSFSVGSCDRFLSNMGQP